MSNLSEMLHPEPIPFYTTLILFLLLLGFIGWQAARSTKFLSDFLVMSGKAGAVVGGFAYFASQYSMSTFMGVPAMTYSTGFAGMSVSVPGLAFSMIIPVLFVGRKLMLLGRRYNMLTMSDYLSDRYESQAIRGLHAVMSIIFLLAMMGAQTVGAGVILHTFTGLPEWIGVVAMGVIVVLYCMTGGMTGAMMTDVLQGALMVATAVVTFVVSVQAGGGMEAITAKMAQTMPTHLTHPGTNNDFPWQTYVSMIVMWSFFTIGQPTLFTKFFTMNSYRTMFKAVILGTLGMLFSATMIEWSGVNASTFIHGLTKKDADFIVPLILEQNVSPWISALLITGIVSAGMSTISALLVVCTGGITRDIYQNMFNPAATQQQILKLSRWFTIIVGVAAVIIGIMKPAGIFSLIRFAFGGLGIWVAPVILGMYWKRATRAGAICSVIIGEVVYVAMKLWWPGLAFGFDPLIVCWAFTMVVMIAISMMTTPATVATLERHFSLFRNTTPGV
ncbi:sodium:solute symporter family protein [Citrobacter rodentium]|jgi:transporter, SSS family|nr:sodium:solute symporter family protein [Citrobacter rodentium]KIQ51311.1 sodium:solute symporter [Citrobacter rodentium]QBY28120.1 sodium:solute symporter family protein [Citrobacter rodentium]UHO30002.1 sodium:solute symporter family protein [Citrobacter rodentium NBRC 105723 = DSM 16636]HAT8011497.1 sodium:solute symporter family protein [Citrobacter rodentium NBRC 105723 = DSM 16636]HAT8016311.1 sodium:solute symporter family protein [Citrobacter rodentium]